MSKIAEVFTKIARQRWTILAVVLGILAVAALFWARADTNTEESVEETWDDEITKLGIEPVYPPEEDVQVGDIIAIVSRDELFDNKFAKAPIANRALRLWRKDVSGEVLDNYKNSYVFRGLHDQPSTQLIDESVLKPKDHLSDLPLATFPRFKVSNVRSAQLGIGLLDRFEGLIKSKSESVTEVWIDQTVTYGIPAIIAQAALSSFCKHDFPLACRDDVLRKFLSIRVGPKINEVGYDKQAGLCKHRFSVELGLINRVYLTNQITTHLVRGGSTNANFDKTKKDKPTGPNQQDAQDANVLQTNLAGTQSEKTEKTNSATTSDESGAAFDSSELAISFEGKPLEHPVVFGFESVRFVPPSSPMSKPRSTLFSGTVCDDTSS
jgi:hypothetical protein